MTDPAVSPGSVGGSEPASDDHAGYRVVRIARRSGLTVATAESLTAGLVSARIADVPGASAVLRGGVVSYATDLKVSLLGVPTGLLEQHGAVHPEVALAMAAGVRQRLGADLGVGTTGVAGPDPQDGRPPGTAYVAVSGPAGNRVLELVLDGDRAAVRAGVAERALALAADELAALARAAGAAPGGPAEHRPGGAR